MTQIKLKLFLLFLAALSPALVVAYLGKNIIKDVSWGVKVKLHNNVKNRRGFGAGVRRFDNVVKNNEDTESNEESDEDDDYHELEPAKIPANERRKNRRVESISPDYIPPDLANPNNETEDEKDMKLKLFRVMYETVKDNDKQTKLADKIKTEYSKSDIFEIGFIMADITDKYEIITDTANTIQRLYDDWKPVEHVNAFEQITNQAIEINQLIGLLKTLKPNNISRYL